jgi:hypothetical protein
MSALREWIVTLKNREDLDDFYEDMETPGGNLFIPNRAVELVHRREISRNTHYMLTDDEAQLIEADDRVLGVELAEVLIKGIRPNYTITNGSFDKRWQKDVSDINWGLLRQSESSNRSNWGDNGISPVVTDDLTITASGKNVDVVIFDGHIDPDHPEFQVNADGTGGTRVQQINWFAYGGSGTYVYDRSGSYVNALDVDDNNHGTHVAGTVAGNTQGWARDANIYNISPYGTNPNGSVGGTNQMWDYVRAWHNAKSINPATGRKNPTVTNHSYGVLIPIDTVSSVTYRGVTYSPGGNLSKAELDARGFYTGGGFPTAAIEIPYYSTAFNADISDAIADGIICVFAAGNESWKQVNSTDQDYNNIYTGFSSFYSATFSNLYLHRGNSSGTALDATINVGAVSNNVDEVKATFSNCGSQVDVYAAGEAIQSSLLTPAAYSGLFADVDPRDNNYYIGRYQGTSMASPQVCGILTLLAESWPNMTQAEAHAWIIDNANSGQMADSGTDDPNDRTSLQFGPNRYARWINQRAETGASFPQKNFRPRPTSGVAYPRTRIRKRG